MGEAIDRLVALAGPVRVEGHTRTSKSGKTVRVESYTRSPGKMSDEELQVELKALGDKDANTERGLTDQEKNRWLQIATEIRKREKFGQPRGPQLKPAVESLKEKAEPQSEHAKKVNERETEARLDLLGDSGSQNYHKKRIERDRKEGDTRSWFEIWIAELKEADRKARERGFAAADPSVYNNARDLTINR